MTSLCFALCFSLGLQCIRTHTQHQYPTAFQVVNVWALPSAEMDGQAPWNYYWRLPVPSCQWIKGMCRPFEGPDWSLGSMKPSL
ncbi:hypothetical protein EDB82DRAFT_508167 [Fusarium venenatum]|uniref:uncharacterized protein n=1 Tax=Fusarium venenatum TaxID=56646 RepID=UPI001D267417|nr:hypothetical protein EDB82DRAFT_508167 [Fusarium venenatum]